MTTSFEQPVEHHINWGGVIKGVAIVAAVAVAAVVGWWALTAFSTYITGAIGANVTASSLAGGATTLATTAADSVVSAGTYVGNLISQIPAGLASLFNVTGQHFAQAAAVNHVAGLVGAGAGAAIATHAALPYLEHGHYVDTTIANHHGAGMSEAENMSLVRTVPMHDLTHIAHHAAEHADEHAQQHGAWSQRFARTADYTGYADKALAAKEERKAIQPAGSFTEQLNADRANLDVALAK